MKKCNFALTVSIVALALSGIGKECYYDFNNFRNTGVKNFQVPLFLTEGKGGFTYPAIVSIITTPDGKPEITDPRRGLADTTEDAKKEIEKDIPGVVEPEVVAPAPDDATESPSKSGGLFAGIAVLLAALAVGGGYLYFRKRKEAES